MAAEALIVRAPERGKLYIQARAFEHRPQRGKQGRDGPGQRRGRPKQSDAVAFSSASCVFSCC